MYQPRRGSDRSVSALLFVTLLAAWSAGTALGATHIWTGLDGASWSSAGNWDNGVPAGAADTAIVFDSATTPSSTMDIAGGLTLNSMTFTAAASPREILAVAGRSLIFDGADAFINHFNATGTGTTVLRPTVTLNQTLTLNGLNSFDRQFIFRPDAGTSGISGNGGLRVQSGVFATNGNNTYTGATVVSGGLLGGSTSAAFGNSSSVTVESGGGIQLFGTGTVNVNRPLFLSGSGDGVVTTYALAATSGAGNTSGGTKAWAGEITLLGNSTMRFFGGSPLALTGASPLDLNGHTASFITSSGATNAISLSKPIQGSGGITVNADPSSGGVNLVSDANTFTGAVHVANGFLGVSSNQALGNSDNVLTLDGGGLRAQSIFVFSTSLVIPESRKILIGSGGATFSGRATPSSSEALVLQTSLSGSNPIRIERQVRFDAANTFDGTLTLMPGASLTIAADAALGDHASQLRFEGTAASPSVLKMPTPVSLSAARTFEISGETARLDVIGGSEILSSFSGPGRLLLNQIGSGTVVLGGTNTHAGGTRLLSGGFFQIDNDSAFGASGSPLAVAGGWLKAGGNLEIPGTRPTRIETFGTLIDTNGFEMILNNDIEDGDAFAGFDIQKQGAGTLVYNGNAPEGHFRIDEGNFGGSGSVKRLSLSREVVFSPGNSTGLFSVSEDFNVIQDFEFSFDVRLLMELGDTSRGQGYDALDVGGTARLDGSLLLQLVNGFQDRVSFTDTFTLLQSGNLTGEFLNAANGQRLSTVDGLGSFIVSYGPESPFDPTSVVLSAYLAVPEPGALGIVGMACGLMLRRPRRHR